MAQKAALLAPCAGFGLYATRLAGCGWGLAVDRAGAPPGDLGTACVDHLGSARAGNLRVNLLRKLCFRGLKMVSAGPLFIGGAGHTRKNLGGRAGLTVSELSCTTGELH